MANPQVHARSSARKFGGVWEDYIELHSFLDSSKLHYAKAQHRALLHHDFGKKLAIELFCNDFGAHGHAKVEALVFYHFAEDFTKFTPTVTQWFEGSDVNLRPSLQRTMTLDEHCVESVRQFGGEQSDYRELHQFLDSITSEIEAAWGITHSTFGLGLAEMKFGYVVGPRNVPTRTIAERHILAEYGLIPSVQDWLSAVPLKPWMYNQAAQLSVELDTVPA